MFDPPDTEIKEVLQIYDSNQDLVKDNTWNYVHFLDKKSDHIQRQLLLLVSRTQQSLRASRASFSMSKESNTAA